MSTQIILIQAASRAWSGAPDWCMNTINGRPVVALTAERALDAFPAADVRIIAPAFDKGGSLDAIPTLFPGKSVTVYYGYDDSPLDRMIAVLHDQPDDTLFIRVDGLHFGWLREHAQQMLETARQNNLDCIKMPDNYPIQLTSDIYRLGALKKASNMLKTTSESGPFKVHPKFFLTSHREDFKTAHHADYSQVNDEYLTRCRKIAQDVYVESNTEVTGASISGGDQFSFHYTLGLEYISPNDTVLDIACGWGYGAKMLAEKASSVVAADISAKTIESARLKRNPGNLTFHIADVTNLEFNDASFDAITSFETVEHVNPSLYFNEISRVLRPGGLLILSTPQNSLGHIPINSQHLREFSIEEITALCSEYFTVQKIIGIKQGRVVFPEDPKGQNTFMVCQKPE